MKKFISGIIVGALLFTGASAFADSVSLIGQKVQGIFTVEKGGKKVAEAVIINGTAYAPVRAVSEAVGTKLIVEGKKIIMDGEAIVDIANESPLVELTSKREALISSIAKLESSIKGNEENNIPFHENLAKELAGNGDLGTRNQEAADAYKKQVREDKANLADLQAQLKEIDAKIAALGE